MTKLTREEHEKLVKDLENHPNKSRVDNMITSHAELKEQLKVLQELVSNKKMEELKEKWIKHQEEALKHSKIEDKIIFVDIYKHYQDRIPNEGKGMKFIDEQHKHLENTILNVEKSLKGDDIEQISKDINDYCNEQFDHMNEEEILLIPLFLNFSFYEYTCYAAGIGYKFATGAAK